MIGTGVPFSFSSTKFGQLFGNYDNLRQIGTSIGLSPFVRYYVGSAKLKPFVGIAYSYSRTVSKYKTDTAGGSESKSQGQTTALTPTLGVAYFVNRNLALTASLNYNINHIEYRTVQTSPYTPGPSIADIDSKSLSLGLGFQLFIGKFSSASRADPNRCCQHDFLLCSSIGWQCRTRVTANSGIDPVRQNTVSRNARIIDTQIAHHLIREPSERW